MLRTSTGGQSLYVYTGQGTPGGLITDAGTTTFAQTFDPYGAATLTSGGSGNEYQQNPFTFSGGIQDRATGWVHFGARWYNPTTGRWTQQDTLDSPLDPANANRYAYAGDDPINLLDPQGLRSAYCAVYSSIAAGAGAVAGVAGAYAAATAVGNVVPVAGQANTGVALTITAVSALAAGLAGIGALLTCGGV